MKKVKVELISDIICPWCYIAKARIERVVEALEKEDIQLDLRLSPYLLYPHIPKGGSPKADFAKVRKPGMGRSLREEAKEEGIIIDYKKIERIPNSLEAHRLLWLIENNEVQFNLARALFREYFEEGNNVEDPKLLIREATKVGVEDSIIEIFQNSQQGEEEVNLYIRGLKDQFIMAVPTFIIANRLQLQGIQPYEVFYKYFKRAAERFT